MERSQLLGFNQIKFLDKIHEMFQAGVDVGLLTEHHDLVVRKYFVSFYYLLHHQVLLPP